MQKTLIVPIILPQCVAGVARKPREAQPTFLTSTRDHVPPTLV